MTGPVLALLVALLPAPAPPGGEGAAARAWRAALAAERWREPAPPLPRGAFLQRPAITAVTLSPDGRRVAWLREQAPHREVWTRPAAGGEPRRLLENTPASGLSWTLDGRWLLLESERQVFALAAAGQPGSGLVTPLGGRDERRFLEVDASRPAAVIVLDRVGTAAQGQAGWWRLLRVDVHGRSELLWQDARRITGYALDRGGRLAWLERLEGQALVIHHLSARGALREVLRCELPGRCTLLAATPDGALLLRGDVGAERSRLLRLDADGRLGTQHADPREEADIGDVVLDPFTRRPLLAAYRTTVTALHALDPAVAAHLAVIQGALPGRDLRIEVGRGDGARWLVHERASTQQGTRWHVYDPAARALTFLHHDAPRDRRGEIPVERLPEAAMARKLPVTWRASDGMRLHGFLSLPPGRDPASLPLVVNVHGGPWNHARPEFNRVVQLLVNRGYAVFEPNFRGSTGHGRGYLLAARGDFGLGRVWADVEEGTRAMLARGIGDARRVGIVGASFGGYSALLGLTFRPELFKVGVAMVPPPDFAWTLRWILRNPEALQLGDALPVEAWLRAVALDPGDREAMATLHAQAPLANVARMNRPLLIVAAGKDRRVGIAGVIEYAARLRLAGKDVTLVVDDDAGHDVAGPLALEAHLFALETMLHRELGGAAPEAPDAELRTWLSRNMRMAGPAWPRP